MDVAKKKALKAQFAESGPAHCTVFVQRPVVFVECLFEFAGEKHPGIGFAKVSRPDKWSESYGVELAVQKAASAVAKRLAADNGETPAPTALTFESAAELQTFIDELHAAEENQSPKEAAD